MVFSFFKKPPPEKMVAKPAAAPPRPKSGEAPFPDSRPLPEADARTPAAPAPGGNQEAPRELESLDFTSSSQFSDLSETPGDIHVETDIDPIQADVEQAAILYANAQDDVARAMLENAVHANPFGPGERLWLMLFDLYRLTNQRTPFDALSLEYARAFERSPPAWRNSHTAKPAAKAVVAVPAGTMLFKGELTGDNDSAFAALDQSIDKNPKLRVELTKVTAVDDLGAERLLGVLCAARKKKVDIELVGRDALAALLEARIETGRREESGCWLLLIELYQLMGKQEAFEDMAINYAVTFEMSPPSWEPKRVAAAEPKPVLALAARAPEEEALAYAPKGDLKAERFANLQGFAEKQEVLILDFSAVTRIDFVSAGTLVNLLTTVKRQGKRIVVRHPNRLVAELLGVVGLAAVADIEFAKS
ncbi:MAG: sodium-independent anion transporter [Rhodocyclales bacterium]|nr:sodium-independent anion transporter [Rhodocyclales bacterium]